ncbi:MAG TPA: CHAT domain-containing protein, partial [Anaerolineales bacterium]
MSEYADLEIRILEQQPGGYPVEITFNNEQQFPRGFLDPAFLPWTPGISATEDGERLLNWLLADPALKSSWAEVRGQQPQRRIRLRIDATAPELHTLPWELLRDASDGGVAQDLAAAAATPFSRYLAGRWQPGSPILKRPVRVLVAISAPENIGDYQLAAIDVQQEWEALQAAAAGQTDLQLELLPQPCTLSVLEEALKKGYHVLHFIGHGAYRSSDSQAVLYLADAQNKVALLRDQELAVEGCAELAGGVNGDQVLHGEDGGHAGGDQLGRQAAEGLGRAARGGLAAGQKDQAQFVILQRVRVSQQAGEQGGQLLITDQRYFILSIGEVEHGLAIAGAVGAVADEMQDVIAFF